MPLFYLRGLWGELSEQGRKTLPWDLVRGACEGAGSTFVGTFALLIAIEYFHCDTGEKSLIAAGSHWGLGLSVFYATYAHAFIGRRNIEAAIPMFLGAFCFLACALVGTTHLYALVACFGSLCLGLRSPLMTALYRENYKASVRGQIFGIILVVMAGSGVLFTSLGGEYLDRGISGYPAFVVVIAVMALLGAFSTLQIPAIKHPRSPIPNPFSYFSALRDMDFVYVILTWFLFGMANLAMLPQRFEYLTQGHGGFSLSPGTTALVIGVIPELVRVLAVIPMGRLFDRMNFIMLRIVINLFLVAFNIVFFSASGMWGLYLGAVFLGIGNAGGSVAWSLWVTRYATPENTAKYMAVHTFFTGLRGIFAPYLGYWVASVGSIRTAAWISTGMIVVSCVILWYLEQRASRNGRRMEDLEITPELEE
jgi:MFS family permease